MKTIALLLFITLLTHNIQAEDDPRVFETEHFRFTLINTTISDEEVKLTFLYTNLQNQTSWGYIGSFRGNDTYLIDQLGERFLSTSNESMGDKGTFPSDIPVKMSITYGKSPGSKMAYITFEWHYGKDRSRQSSVVYFKNFSLESHVSE
jgi:hypothetical protein